MLFTLLAVCSVSMEEEFLRWAKGHEQEVDYRDLYEVFLKDLTPQKEPLLLAIGGGPGAGKTTLRKKLQETYRNLHLHDMDEVKERLPGYKADLMVEGPKAAFEKWWRPAMEISEVLVGYALKSKYSIIYDRSCGTEASYWDLVEAKEQGYTVRLTGLYANRSVALERAERREREGGFAVTEEIVDEYRARFSALWPYYLKFVDEATLYDSNGEVLRLIFSSQEGVIDQEAYGAFLKEGAGFAEYFKEKLQ